MPPFFSIVMAVQNALPHLEVAVESIQQQTFKDFELIIVDDHSTDGTRDYLHSLQDPRLRLLLSDGQGQTYALNVGIQAAETDWIVRMDGDDWCDPRRLALQRAAILSDSKRPVMVTSNYVICDEDLRPIAPICLEPPTSRLRTYLEKHNNPFCHPTVVFHRPTALDVGLYDTRIRNAQDYHLWLRLLSGRSWVHVPATLVHYRVRRGSLSVLYQPEQTQDRKSILQAHHTGGAASASTRKKAASAEAEAIYNYKLGFSAWLAGRRALMVHHLIRSIQHGGSLRIKAAACIVLGLLFPRRIYLTLAGYRGVYA